MYVSIEAEDCADQTIGSERKQILPDIKDLVEKMQKSLILLHLSYVKLQYYI